MSKCGACGKFVSPTDGVKCSKCSIFYDRQCLKLAKTYKIPVNWICPICQSKQPRKDNTETPVKNAQEDDYSPAESVSKSPITDSNMSGLVSEIQMFRSEMTGMRDEFKFFNSQFEKLIGAVDGLNKRLDGIESRVAALEERSSVVSTNDAEVPKLLDTIEKLKMDLNDRDQEMLTTDIEITGIPEVKGENLIHLVCLVSEKLGVELEERDIVSAERVGPRREQASNTDDVNSSKSRPRPLVVKLVRRSLRNSLLREARVRRGADTDGFQLQGPPRRFYVNERLTRTNRILFYNARQEGMRLGFKYVWSRDGRIFARRRPDTQAFRLRSDEDIKKVFS